MLDHCCARQARYNGEKSEKSGSVEEVVTSGDAMDGTRWKKSSPFWNHG